MRPTRQLSRRLHCGQFDRKVLENFDLGLALETDEYIGARLGPTSRFSLGELEKKGTSLHSSVSATVQF